MRLKRKLVLPIAAAVVAAAIVGRVTAPEPGEAAPADAPAEAVDAAALESESYLFSQTAAGGSLRGTDERELTLTLSGVRDRVTRFTDRPARKAQTVDVRDFLARWDARFAVAPPNAVLSYRSPAERAPRELVLELRNPRYDRAARTMTYDARRIPETTDRIPGTKHPRRPVVQPLPRTFGAAALFIDDSSGDEVDVIVNDVSAQNNGQDEAGVRLAWRADLSQCAGYGTSDWRGGLQVYASYDSFSDGHCFFKPTYARFNIMVVQPDGSLSNQGTITFSSSGFLVSCVGFDCSPYGGRNADHTIDVLGGGEGGP